MENRVGKLTGKVFFVIAALMLAMLIAPTLAHADGETEVVNHKPLAHKPYSAIHQDYGPQTVYLKCDWERNLPSIPHQQCEFHDWILISMPHIWTYYNGQPWPPKFTWQTRRNYPFIELHDGLPSGTSIVTGFTYEGINGTVYGPSYEAPVDPGHYSFYTVIHVPHVEDPLAGINGYFKLEAELHIRSSEFTLSFDANHPDSASTKEQASGTMDALDFASVIDEKQLPMNEFKLPGYKFMGWNTKANGKGARYADEEFVKGVDGISKYGEDVTLYAQWEPLEYTITLKGGDPSRPDLEQTAYFDQPGTLMDVASEWTIPDKTKLQGWSVSGAGLFYEDQAPFCNLCVVQPNGGVSGLTLDANFVYEGQIIAVVTKDGVAQANAANSFKLTDQYGTVFTVPATYSNGRYTFDPTSAISPAGTPAALPQGSYTLTFEGDGLPAGTAEIVYGPDSAAHATLDYYTVKAEPVAGDKGITSVAINDEQELVVFEGSTVNISASVKTGYHFDGYSVVGVDPVWGASDPTVADQSITINGTATIVARSAPNTYTVHFDANTTRPVMGEMEDVVATYDQEQDLPANQFVVAGGTFLGWNTQADGKGTAYADEAEILNLVEADGGKITLYAQWEIAKFNIDFVDHDGTKLYNTVVEYGTVPVYEGEEPSRAPDAKNTYTFIGWEPLIAEANKDATYKAVYKATPIPPQKAALTFDLAGGTLGGQTGSVTIEASVGDSVELPAAPTREGHTFRHWADSEAEYDPGDKYEVAGDHAFTAVWEKDEPKPPAVSTITYDLDGGTLDGKTGTITLEVENGTTITLPEPTRDGYTFRHWADSEAEYLAGAGYTVEGDHAFKAVWEKNQEPEPQKAALAFDLAGGTLGGQTGSVTIEATVGDSVEIPAAPTREGYTFRHWADSEAEYDPGDKYEVEGDHAFKAVWEKDEPKPPAVSTITYDLDGGTLDGKTGTVEVEVENGTAITLPEPARDGHTFKHWADSEAEYDPGDKYTAEGDHAFAAVWEKNQEPEPQKAALAFDLAGGTLGGETGTVTLEASVQMSSTFSLVGTAVGILDQNGTRRRTACTVRSRGGSR